MKITFKDRVNLQYRKNIKIATVLFLLFSVLLISSSFLILNAKINEKTAEKECLRYTEVDKEMADLFNRTVQINSSYAISNTEFGLNWDEKDINAYNSLIYQIKLNLAMNSFIDEIYIKNSNFEIVQGSKNAIDMSTLESLYNLGTATLCTAKSDNDTVLLISSSYLQTNGEKNTISLFYNSFEIGKDIFKQYSEDEKEFIVSENGEILISNRTELLSKNLFTTLGIDKFELVNSSFKSKDLGKNITVHQIAICPTLFFVRIYDSSIYAKEYASLSIIFIAINIIALLLFAISSLIIAKYTYKPVRQLLDLVCNYSSSPLENIDEITYIKNQISNVYSDNTALQKTVCDKIKDLQEQQLIALQSQISPHFLLNSLDAISWLSIDKYGEDNTIFENIQYIRNILSQCINITSVFSPIRDEISLTKNCISLLQLKYNCNICLNINTPEELLNAQILRFSLQPIAENSVKHGLINNKNGKININISSNDKNLTITVKDNGCGIPTKSLKEINERLSDINKTEKEHIGLKNIVQRFKILYGNDFTFSIKSQEDGTEVLLEFPAFYI